MIKGTEIIPKITNPLGKHWEQPLRGEIIITDKYAIMTPEASKKLKTYNTTFPTGVYIGKMFQRQGHLVWFSEDPDPTFVKNNYREIIERPKQFLQCMLSTSV